MKTQPAGAVVTGAGVVTSLGASLERNWSAVLDRRSGIVAAGPDVLRYCRLRAAAPAPAIDIEPLMRQPKLAKFATSSTQSALAAAREAIDAAGGLQHVDPARRGIYVASGDTSLDVETFLPALDVAWSEGAPGDWAALGGRASRLVDPYFQLRTLANGAAAIIAIEHEIHGPSTNFVQGTVAGAQAIQAALDDLADARVDVALVVGCDGLLSTSILEAYDAIGLLSPLEPPHAMRPFDADRAGLVPGIGAGALVLERAASAGARDVRRLGVISGVGTAAVSADAPHTDRNDGALRRAFAAMPDGFSSSRDLLVVAHGDATIEGDANELRALAGVVTEGAVLTAFKGATGFIGAAGPIVETAFTLRALADGVAPAIVGRLRPGPAAFECGLRLAGGDHQRLSEDATAAILAWSWSGACAVIAVDR